MFNCATRLRARVCGLDSIPSRQARLRLLPAIPEPLLVHGLTYCQTSLDALQVAGANKKHEYKDEYEEDTKSLTAARVHAEEHPSTLRLIPFFGTASASILDRYRSLRHAVSYVGYLGMVYTARTLAGSIVYTLESKGTPGCLFGVRIQAGVYVIIPAKFQPWLNLRNRMRWLEFNKVRDATRGFGAFRSTSSVARRACKQRGSTPRLEHSVVKKDRD
ncbi:hypothetical protein C8R43DRAFT_950393 [Mycena crocata]|nr:hypothetical protein C8R43DRAFT_950393 [Mycena crocata]